MDSQPKNERRGRAAAAGARADELRALGERLRDGDRLTSADATRATEALDEATERREAARASSRQAHLGAAAQHRTTAETLDAAGRPERAAAHRDGARADKAAAEKDETSP